MHLIKNKFFIVFFTSFFIIFLIFLLYTIFLFNNFISFNQHINTKNVSEFVITDDKANKISIPYYDNNFNTINNILCNSKVYFCSDRLFEYDTEKDTIELKCGKKTKKLYTYSTGSGKIFIIVNDFFENSDTSKKLDYPFYIVTEISFMDFYTIFPNSTLLSGNRITVDISVDNQANNRNEWNGKLCVRNDNDCSIKFSKINYNDENISITANLSKDIAPHSNSEIEIIIKTEKDNKSITKYLKEANIKVIFFSAINSNDICEISDIECY